MVPNSPHRPGSLKRLWHWGGLAADARDRFWALVLVGAACLAVIIATAVVLGRVWGTVAAVALIVLLFSGHAYIQLRLTQRTPDVPHVKGCPRTQTESFLRETTAIGMNRVTRCLDCGREHPELVPPERLATPDLKAAALALARQITALYENARDALPPLDMILIGGARQGPAEAHQGDLRGR